MRYFIVVAGALLAMLTVANWCLSSPPPSVPSQEMSTDKAALRIRSERKWPQKIEFDTTVQPFIAPSAPVVATAEPEPANVRPNKPPLDALAQAKPSEPQFAKARPHVRTVRRTHRAPPPVRFAVNPTPQPWPFGW